MGLSVPSTYLYILSVLLPSNCIVVKYREQGLSMHTSLNELDTM